MSRGMITVRAGPLYASEEGLDRLIAETRRRILTPSHTRNDVAEYYALLISLNTEQRNSVPWHELNTAIIERWSGSALDYIKRKAWACR